MVPDALAAYKNSIPQVIIDAMDVVNSLGENYLWSDSLCIVQDDAAEKHHQISHMAIIYSSTVLTLVAVGARDANSNLPGVRPLTRWPREKQKSDAFNRPLRPDLVLKAIDRTVYVSRAWTFQERHLSRRCLYFLDEQVYFQCRMELCCEEQSPSFLSSFVPTSPPEIGLSIMSRAPGWRKSIERKDWDRGFAFYAELIQEYSWKALSYPEDIINAFSGLLNALETHSGWNLTHGLPEQMIDWALLWIPVGLHQRRPPPRSGQLLQFPSWSWIGWIGPITFNLAYDNALLPLSSLLEEVQLETFEENTTNFSGLRRVIRGKIDRGGKPYKSTFLEAELFNLATGKEDSSLPGSTLRFTAMTISAASFQANDIPPWRWNPDIHSDKKARIEQSGVSITFSTGLAGLFLGLSLDFLRRYKWSHLRLVAISRSEVIDDQDDMPIIIPSESYRHRWISGTPDQVDSSHIPFWESYRKWCVRYNTTPTVLYNVMLVQKRGPYYERVAVGQIDQQHWGAANPVKETVLLV
ncbi:uncharacterized protein PAC_08378 [Phialocephala subalpina]|uniref:Heterokaryon incompatibility domain-containing protein n=1 Tax=Phialocephala subalpina TaxID=576137 RepID=A0A1L7X0D5_9HELO|nr:uncharacterized protein PAC_08378 [Phialocephala subalpina]